MICRSLKVLSAFIALLSSSAAISCTDDSQNCSCDQINCSRHVDRVCTVLQGDGEMFAEVPVESSVLWVPEALERHLAFWGGEAPPAAVAKEDAWKCGFCLYRRQCQAGAFFSARGFATE